MSLLKMEYHSLIQFHLCIRSDLERICKKLWCMPNMNKHVEYQCIQNIVLHAFECSFEQ